MKEQFEILRQMQQDGYNVVTCGNCGDVVLLEIKDYASEIECPYCNETMEHCDMPDLVTD